MGMRLVPLRGKVPLMKAWPTLSLSESELRDWARRIREQPWGDAYVFLKHEEEGKGPKLAARLTEFCRG